jgi:hypothetical protein
VFGGELPSMAKIDRETRLQIPLRRAGGRSALAVRVLQTAPATAFATAEAKLHLRVAPPLQIMRRQRLQLAQPRSAAGQAFLIDQ